MPAPARGAMADQLLSEKRRIFVHSVGAGTINALLDCLLEDRVISQEDMNKVRDENDTVMDKARVLIDLVIGKGPEACCKFIRHLCEEDPPLASKMGLRKE
ncbi:caspase recruitment domain-containing protein 18 [Callithrix jacchus]